MKGLGQKSSSAFVNAEHIARIEATLIDGVK
jgi:hypothetical protein